PSVNRESARRPWLLAGLSHYARRPHRYGVDGSEGRLAWARRPLSIGSGFGCSLRARLSVMRPWSRRRLAAHQKAKPPLSLMQDRRPTGRNVFLLRPFLNKTT